MNEAFIRKQELRQTGFLSLLGGPYYFTQGVGVGRDRRMALVGVCLHWHVKFLVYKRVLFFRYSD